MKHASFYTLRYRKYMDMVAKGVVQPENMTPTDRAAFFHGVRAHHQITIWKFE